MGKPYRYGYMICRSPTSRSGDMSLGAIGRYDHQTGELKTWEAGENSGVQEPLFVPRHQGAPEGDGWLLAPVNRVAENRSDIAVLDATKPEAGPVALIKLPVRIRSTFHGMLVPEDALQTGRYDV
jgi:carotenoid cleavage dioxygenase-like enzyme